MARAYNLLPNLQEQLQRSEAGWDREAEREERLLALIEGMEADLAATTARVAEMDAMLMVSMDGPEN